MDREHQYVLSIYIKIFIDVKIQPTCIHGPVPVLREEDTPSLLTAANCVCVFVCVSVTPSAITC